jgi:guanosine-3',5'-bis(diphosphate) 3'-pyrophosphohydrolase
LLRLNDILDKVAAYHPAADLDLIKKAYVYSAKVHQGQIRKSGEPYLVHPLEVAGILAELRLDEASIVTGLLHDTIEDTLATREEIAELFGEEEADLVDGVTKLSQFSAGNTKVEKQAENFRKMVVAMAKDIRVLLVKLADRIHNMRTLEHMAPEKQERIAQETLDIYAPLSNRLGMQSVKSELEDLSFRYLKPTEHGELLERVSSKAKERDRFVEEVVELIQARLAENGIQGKTYGRVKHLYSIWRKMHVGDLPFEQIHDLVAFRVIVGSVAQCYEALGLIHSLWKPVPGRFKDYIAIPKPNLYQSLHTTVVGPRAERIEIQIRTDDMHRVAEQGVAAHWKYKESPRDGKGKPGVRASDADQFGWLRQLLEWQKELSDPTEFLETVKVDLFADEVFVFTPKGDVKSLPRGATPHAQPSKDWLTFVRTSRAQARIRQYIRQAEHRRSLEIGKEVAERELRRYGVSLSRSQKDGSLDKAAASLGFRIGDDVLVAIGYGKVAPDQLLRLLVSPLRPSPASPAASPRSSGRWRAARPEGCASAASRTSSSATESAAIPFPATPSWASSPAAAESRCTRPAARRGSPWTRSGGWTSPGT